MSDDKKAETNEAVRRYLRTGGATGVGDAIAARLEARMPKNKDTSDDITTSPTPLEN